MVGTAKPARRRVAAAFGPTGAHGSSIPPVSGWPGVASICLLITMATSLGVVRAEAREAPQPERLQIMRSTLGAATEFLQFPAFVWTFFLWLGVVAGQERDRSARTSARTSAPKRSSFVPPIPEMAINAASSEGRCSAIAVNVASVNTT